MEHLLPEIHGQGSHFVIKWLLRKNFFSTGGTSMADHDNPWQQPVNNNNQQPVNNSSQQPVNNNSQQWQPPQKPKNRFATVSLMCGIFGILSLCCMGFPLSIIMGVGAVCFAVLSRQGRPMYGTAIAGIILGVIAVILGILEFVYIMAISSLAKDPANAALINQFVEQIEQQMQQMQQAK